MGDLAEIHCNQMLLHIWDMDKKTLFFKIISFTMMLKHIRFIMMKLKILYDQFF